MEADNTCHKPDGPCGAPATCREQGSCPWPKMRVQPGGAPLNPKDVAGRSKPQLALIPVKAMAPVARVMELGAKKYGPYNWRQVPIGFMAYLHALRRHLDAVIDGQDIDPESGQAHLAHVAATAMIVLDAYGAGTLREDRPTVPMEGEIRG